MKTSTTKGFAALFSASVLLVSACGGDGGSRRLPGGQLNIEPDQIEIITPAHNATNVCRFSDMIVRVLGDANCDSADVYREVSSFMQVTPASSTGGSGIELTEGYPNPATDGSGCDITFRMKRRTAELTDHVIQVKGIPAGSIGTNKQSAKFKTDQNNQACGDEAFFVTTEVKVGGKTFSPITSYQTNLDALISSDPNEGLEFNGSMVLENLGQFAYEIGQAYILGLGRVSPSSVTRVIFNDTLEDFSMQYDFRLYQVSFDGSDFGSITAVNLDGACGSTSCAYRDPSYAQGIRINPPGGSLNSGQVYVWVIGKGMTSENGRMLKFTYMIPFMTQ